MTIYIDGRFYRRSKGGDPRATADRVAMAFAREGRSVVVMVKTESKTKGVK